MHDFGHAGVNVLANDVVDVAVAVAVQELQLPPLQQQWQQHCTQFVWNSQNACSI